MLAIQGIYDGKVVVPKEKMPYKGTIDVIITFPSIDNSDIVSEKLNALQELVGIAAGNTMTEDAIKTARLTRQ